MVLTSPCGSVGLGSTTVVGCTSKVGVEREENIQEENCIAVALTSVRDCPVRLLS
jgi:hypothetical protein